jgi:hypothetical protein
VCVCVCVCITAIPIEEKQVGRPSATEMTSDKSSIPEIGGRGMLLSQTLQNQACQCQALPSCVQELGNIPDGLHPEVD